MVGPPAETPVNSGKPISLDLNVRGLGLSATLAIDARCHELRAADRSIYDFGLGQSPFPVPAPVVEALRQAAAEKDYLPVRGLPALREAIATYYEEHERLDAHPQRVLVGPGSKELMFLLQVVHYGEMLIPTPCWVSYMPQAQILGRRISRIHTRFEEEWKLTAAALVRSIEAVHDDTRPRLIVMNYPANPTGCSYTGEELGELAEIARRYQTIVLSDEIYGPLHHDGGHVSIARYYPEGTIISSGLSKWCGAGGWRLGTFVFPAQLEWLIDALANVASETYTSVCAPIQHAAVTAFRGGEQIERYLAHVRRILKTLGRRCHEVLTDAGLRIPVPDGAFYLFLDFAPFQDRLARRGIRDGATLCQGLLEDTGVAILPGAAFGRPRGELTARLAYVDFDGERALAASENHPLREPLPADFFERHCGRVLEGAQKVAEWVAT